MFDIARKYNTQLICLSDIKQGSVLKALTYLYDQDKAESDAEDFLELEPVFERTKTG